MKLSTSLNSRQFVFSTGCAFSNQPDPSTPGWPKPNRIRLSKLLRQHLKVLGDCIESMSGGAAMYAPIEDDVPNDGLDEANSEPDINEMSGAAPDTPPEVTTNEAPCGGVSSTDDEVAGSPAGGAALGHENGGSEDSGGLFTEQNPLGGTGTEQMTHAGHHGVSPLAGHRAIPASPRTKQIGAR